jgi:hypothetical protein
MSADVSTTSSPNLPIGEPLRVVTPDRTIILSSDEVDLLHSLLLKQISGDDPDTIGQQQRDYESFCQGFFSIFIDQGSVSA